MMTSILADICVLHYMLGKMAVLCVSVVFLLFCGCNIVG